MNNLWTKIILLVLLLSLVLAPFAGFAPLLLIILLGGTFWLLTSIFKILILGKSQKQSRD